VPATERRSRIPEVLELVGLKGRMHSKIRTYSKGMKQRLGIAQAMFHRPEVIFLDEPTDGVDPLGRVELRQVIRTAQTAGTTIFLNSHLLTEVEEICDEIAILHRGTVLTQGSVGAVTATVAGQGEQCVVTFTTTPIAAEVLALLPAGAVPLDGQRGFQVNLERESGISPLIDLLRARSIEIYGIQQAKLDLEDAFIELLKAPAAEAGA